MIQTHDLRTSDDDNRACLIGNCRKCGKRGVPHDGYCVGSYACVLQCHSELGILHAVMYWENTNAGWLNQCSYMHGESIGDVALKFWRVRQGQRTAINLVGIAPAIGLFVEDKQGMVLSAT